tara:strand:+ start:29 stop:535 length:507 start_codon:yes stop_codon:yes gene_type:complete
MSFIFGGGGGGGGGGSTSGTQVSIAREAPEVESRKLALYDQAAKLAEKPVGIPAFQVAGPSGLEQTGFQQAGTTGVGAPTTAAGIGSVLGAQQTAAGAPNIAQFMNPYQQYVTDEIARQGQMAQNQLSAQAVGQVHSVVQEKVFKEQSYKEQHKQTLVKLCNQVLVRL